MAKLLAIGGTAHGYEIHYPEAVNYPQFAQTPDTSPHRDAQGDRTSRMSTYVHRVITWGDVGKTVLVDESFNEGAALNLVLEDVQTLGRIKALLGPTDFAKLIADANQFANQND